MATIQHSALTSIHPFAHVASSDPGAVGANKAWVDTSVTPHILRLRNAGNTAWLDVGQSTTTIAAATFLGNNTGGAAAPVALTVSQTKTLLSLGNVDNTSDANKPVSTAQATAIGAKLSIGSNLSDLANAGTARTNLGLGTGAVLDTGTTANKLVKLNSSAQLPAVDGSLLTNLPTGTADFPATYNAAALNTAIDPVNDLLAFVDVSDTPDTLKKLTTVDLLRGGGIKRRNIAEWNNDVAAAVTMIGSAVCELVIGTDYTASASVDLTIPATCGVIFENRAKITVPSGRTLTINRLVDPGDQQIVSLASTTAHVRFGNYGIYRFSTMWITGTSITDVTQALNELLASTGANTRGRIWIPNGGWYTDGYHAMTANTEVQGSGQFSTTLLANATGLAVKTFSLGNVTTATGNIAISGHGFSTGQRVYVRLVSGTLPIDAANSGSVTDGVVMFVIRIDANNIKLARTKALALAGTQVTYLPSDIGTVSLTPHTPVFTHGGVGNVTIKDLTIEGSNITTSVGYLIEGTYGVDPPCNGLRFKNVGFRQLGVGRHFNGLLGDWQAANVSMDFKCHILGCAQAEIYNTVNTIIKNDALYQVNPGQRLGTIHRAGPTVWSCEFQGSAYNGREQVLRQVVVPNGAQTSGTGQVVITKNGVTLVTVYVTGLNSGVHTTGAALAAEYIRALSKDPIASSNFHFSLVGSAIYLISLDRLANDTTLNFTIDNAVGTMVTTNTNANVYDGTGSGSAGSLSYITGVAEVSQAEGWLILGVHGPLSFTDGWAEEGFVTFIQNEANDLNGQINFYGGSNQARLLINQPCQLNFIGTQVVDRIVRDASGAGCIVDFSAGSRVVSASAFANQGWNLYNPTPTAFGTYPSNGGSIAYERNPSNRDIRTQFRSVSFFNSYDAFRRVGDAPGEFLLTTTTSGHETRPALLVGKCDEAGNKTAWYGMYRNDNGATDFRLKFQSSQVGIGYPYVGYDFDLDVTMPQLTVGSGTVISKILKGTVTIDPASVAATTASEQSFTLTGAVVGDSLTLNPPTAGLTTGLLVQQAYVSATNTIKVTFYNTTGSAIDQASGSWTYKLVR